MVNPVRLSFVPKNLLDRSAEILFTTNKPFQLKKARFRRNVPIRVFPVREKLELKPCGKLDLTFAEQRAVRTGHLAVRRIVV